MVGTPPCPHPHLTSGLHLSALSRLLGYKQPLSPRGEFLGSDGPQLRPPPAQYSAPRPLPALCPLLSFHTSAGLCFSPQIFQSKSKKLGPPISSAFLGLPLGLSSSSQAPLPGASSTPSPGSHLGQGTSLRRVPSALPEGCGSQLHVGRELGRAAG